MAKRKRVVFFRKVGGKRKKVTFMASATKRPRKRRAASGATTHTRLVTAPESVSGPSHSYMQGYMRGYSDCKGQG